MVNMFGAVISRIKKAGDSWSYSSFFESEWIGPSSRFRTSAGLYLLYRLTIWLFVVINFFAHLITAGSFSSSFALLATFSYLTIQSMTLVNLYFTLELFLAVVYYLNQKKNRENFDLTVKEEPTSIPLSVRAKGTLGNVTIVSAFTVTVLYWSLLFKYDDDSSYFNIFVHGLNSVVCLIDLLIIERKISIYQVYQSMLFGLWYILFSLFYFLAGGTNADGDPYIYPILDWRNPGLAISVGLLALVGVIINHLLVYLFYKLRLCLRKAILGSSKSKEKKEIEASDTAAAAADIYTITYNKHNLSND